MSKAIPSVLKSGDNQSMILPPLEWRKLRPNSSGFYQYRGNIKGPMGGRSPVLLLVDAENKTVYFNSTARFPLGHFQPGEWLGPFESPEHFLMYKGDTNV